MFLHQVVLSRDKKLEDSVRIYVNRLSDYLFTAARYAAKFEVLILIAGASMLQCLLNECVL